MTEKTPPALSRRKKVLFLLLTVALAFLLLHWLSLLLLYHLFPATILFEPDAFRGVRVKAHLDVTIPIGSQMRRVWGRTGARYHVLTDGQGFRTGPGQDPGTRPAPGRGFTCIFLGDSHTFGADVDAEAVYPEKFRGLLRPKLPGLPLRMINAGVPDYTSRQGLVYLSRDLLADRPDLVVFAFGIHENAPSFFRTWCPLAELSDPELMPRIGLGQFQPIQLSFRQTLRRSVLRVPIIATGYGLFRVIQFNAFLLQVIKSPQTIPSPVHSKTCRDCRVPAQDFRSDLLDLIQLGRRYQFLPVIAAPFGSHSDYRRIAAEVAAQFQVPFVNIHDRFLRFQPAELDSRPDLKELFRPYQDWLGAKALAENPMLYLTTDGGHPNAVGHALIAEELMNAVTPYLRTPPPAGN